MAEDRDMHEDEARHRRRIGSTEIPAWDGATYHGQPPVKPAPWDWKVALYVFLGGLGGAAQVLGLIADRRDPEGARPMVRRARWLAVATALVGPAFIIGDLKTPRRWYNMLRIFRPTSAMSIGSWLLAAFGGFSGLSLLGQIVGGRGGERLARTAQVPAALAGAGMATYTGALFGATSTPRWAASGPLLSARFGLSGLASAAAALSMTASLDDEDAPLRGALDRVALVATAAELVLSVKLSRAREAQGIALAEDDRTTRATDIAAVGLHALPVALYGMNLARRRPGVGLSLLAGLAVIGGSLAVRQAEIRGGRDSALRPEDTFRSTEHDR